MTRADSEPHQESESPIAGWYPNPGGTGLRWWDGHAWTEHSDGVGVESLAASAPGAAMRAFNATTPSRPGTVLGLVAAFGLFLSCFAKWMTLADGSAYNAFDRGLPWFATGASYGPFDDGFIAHGMILTFVAIFGGYSVVRASRRTGGAAKIVTGLGVFVVLLALLNALSFRSGFSTLADLTDSATDASIGLGLWISLLMGLAFAACGSLLASR